MQLQSPRTAAQIETMLKYNSLYESAIVNVSNYCCSACRGGPAAEEHSDSNKIVLMRHGVFCKHIAKQVVASDVNQTTFFSKGSSYRVSHPADCGDRGTIFSVSPRVLNDLIREFDPSIDDHPERPFPFVTGPCDSWTFFQHREIVMVLESVQSYPPDPLWVDEKAMQLMADVLKVAFQRNGLPAKRHRPRTDANHYDLAEYAKSYIASRIGERVTLDDVARAVESSPFHLARVFRKRTGVPIHRYLISLRLRTSLERLAAGASDLTALASELGFSSHSHFTDTFRREFGRSPSDVRHNSTRGATQVLGE